MQQKNSGGRPQGQTANYQKQNDVTRYTVEGGDDLLRRVKTGNPPAEVFLYGGNVRVFNEAPRGSDHRIAALTLAEGESPSAVHWPVDGLEILAILNDFGEHQIRLLVSELFSYGASRVSITQQNGNRINHYGVYGQETSA